MLLAVALSIGVRAQERQVINLNFGWEFRLNNAKSTYRTTFR